MTTESLLTFENVSKSFVMHLRDGMELPVFENVSFSVAGGECVVLAGPSGIGKSSILKIAYGNYRAGSGRIMAGPPDARTDIAGASARRIIALRRKNIGYISQFLRVIPRVSALDIVAEPAIAQGRPLEKAQDDARTLLARLNLPEKLWSLPPVTFSGGEQQRVNVARGFIADYPILLLDEPTASLDAANRAVVVDLIREKKRAGCALLGIFHDKEIRDQVADRLVDVSRFACEAA